jgi:hypothetical protein
MAKTSLFPVLLLAGVGIIGCGGSNKPAEEPTNEEGSSEEGAKAAAPPPAPTSSGAVEDPDEKRSQNPQPCTGMAVDLLDALSKAACEVPGTKDSEKTKDLKNVLDIKVATSAQKVPPGGKVDVVVTFTNKGKGTLPLRFVVNPLPRFELEAYDAKQRRVDEPKGSHPAWPGNKEPLPAEEKLAEIQLPENASGHVMLSWTASHMKWAPSKAKGAAMGSSYPKEPSTPLPKGKYTIKVLTPLVGAFEGLERDVSAPSVVVEVGK